MVDFKRVDGALIQLSSEEQTNTDAKRVLQTARENRTDDEVAEQDFSLELDSHEEVLRAALEVLAVQAGFTLATFRDAVKTKLIARNFYR